MIRLTKATSGLLVAGVVVVVGAVAAFGSSDGVDGVDGVQVTAASTTADRTAEPAVGDSAEAETIPAELQPEADRVAATMRRAVQDLEYNSELPEPIQQNVLPSGPTWRPTTRPAAHQPVIEAVSPSLSKGGLRIVIRGKHLDVSQVLIGTTPAMILAADSEAITVQIPAAEAPSAAIAVTNIDGSYAIAPAALGHPANGA